MKANQYFVIDRPTVADFLTSSDGYVPVPVTQERKAAGGLNANRTFDYWDTFQLPGIKILKFLAADNNLKVQIIGSLDGSTFTDVVEAEFTVTTATPVIKRIPTYWIALQIQVKPATAGQHGTLATQAAGTTVSSDNAKENTLNDIKILLPATGVAGANKQDEQTAHLASLVAAGRDRIIKEIIMPAGTATHAANDCIAHTPANATTHNLPLAGRVVGGSGAVIACAIKTDNPLWTSGISVIIYDAAPAAFIADNDPFDLMYADKAKVVCQMDITSFNKITGGAGSCAWGKVEGMNRPFKCAVDSQDLYFQLYSPDISSAQVAGQKFFLEVGISRD